MYRYSLPQLEALVAISKLGSFQAAATHLNITQPSVSLRIRELEDALGVTLFEREGRTARLTSDGMVALHYAERVLELLGNMSARLRSGDPLQGTLRVGTSEMLAISILPKVMALLGDRYPRLDIELTIANSFALAKELSSGRLDVAFLANPNYLPQHRIEPLARATVAWVGSQAKMLPGQTVSPEALADTPILSMTKSSPLHEMLTRWWKQEGGVDLAVSTCNSISMLARMVAAGIGVSVLPLCIVRDEIQKGSVITYKQASPFAPLSICAAYPMAAASEGISALIGITRRVMLESRYFLPPEPPRRSRNRP